MIRTEVIGYGLGGMAFHVCRWWLPCPGWARRHRHVARASGARALSRYCPCTSPDAGATDQDIRLVAITTPNDTPCPARTPPRWRRASMS